MIPDRYNVKNLLKTVRQPSLIQREFIRLSKKCHNNIKRIKLGPGVEIMSEDWDNLILLDACRYDAFVNSNQLNGELESRISKGSTSREFIIKNFSGRELHDTVYVTSNPFVGYIDDSTFHAVITLLDQWDSKLQTVPPKSVVNAAKEAYAKYPDKRLIIHFMQPHQPYLGDKAEHINKKIQSQEKSRGWGNKVREPDTDITKLDGVKHLSAPKHPQIDVTKQDVWEAYCETLDIVLKHCERLTDHLSGKTVISADHGELIGEKPLLFEEESFGHPSGIWAKELRQVPWFTIRDTTTERRDIKPEPPERYESIDEDDLSSKLEALGYK